MSTDLNLAGFTCLIFRLEWIVSLKDLLHWQLTDVLPEVPQERLIIWRRLLVVVHFLPLDVALVVALVGVAIIVVVVHVVEVAMMFHLHIDRRRRSRRTGAKCPVISPGPAVVGETPVVVLLVVGEVVPGKDLLLGLSLLLVGDWDFGLGRSRLWCQDLLIHVLKEVNFKIFYVPNKLNVTGIF